MVAPVVVKAAALSKGVAAAGALQVGVLRDRRRRFGGAGLRQHCMMQALLAETQNFAVGLCQRSTLSVRSAAGCRGSACLPGFGWQHPQDLLRVEPNTGQREET